MDRPTKPPRKSRRLHPHEEQADRAFAPPPDNTENPDWLVGAN